MRTNLDYTTDLILYIPVSNFQYFLGWTITKQRIRCLAPGRKAASPNSTLSQSFDHWVTALFVYNIAMYSLSYVCMWGWVSYCIALLWTLLIVPRGYFFCGPFVIFVLCLSCFRVCSLLPCGHMMGKGWPLGSLLWCLIASLSLSNVVSLVRCGTWLYWFLIFAVFLTIELTPCFITVRLTIINRVYAQSSERKVWHS